MNKQFIEVKPNIINPDCVATWVSADVLEQMLNDSLSNYAIDWSCKPKIEWFSFCKYHGIFQFELPEITVTTHPDGKYSIKVTKGINRLMWMLGTSLNEIMVMIRTEGNDYSDSGLEIRSVNPWEHVQLTPFDVDRMLRMKQGIGIGRVIYRLKAWMRLTNSNIRLRYG